MLNDLVQIINALSSRLEQVKTEEDLKKLQVELLGKKGAITQASKSLGKLSAEERPAAGKAINEMKQKAAAQIETRREMLEKLAQARRFEAERVDVTLPPRRRQMGKIQPLTKVYLEIRDIFLDMGFEIVDGPEVELDKYNFEMLNIPKDHPARDMQDTFFVSDDVVLRTHTSPAQVRTMLKCEPPIKMICPGRVYRCDDLDATHSPVFNQIEGLVVDKNISFADLKGTLSTFLRAYFGEDTKTYFRPGFFPFTEPSAEVDVSCAVCKGAGCPACKGAGIIEVLGCGLVNPAVLEMCGLDPKVYSGFAFGLGLDRLANTKYGITDIRLHYENDLRFIEQF